MCLEQLSRSAVKQVVASQLPETLRACTIACRVTRVVLPPDTTPVEAARAAGFALDVFLTSSWSLAGYIECHFRLVYQPLLSTARSIGPSFGPPQVQSSLVAPENGMSPRPRL
jgi:hypothetical protein